MREIRSSGSMNPHVRFDCGELGPTLTIVIETATCEATLMDLGLGADERRSG
jgi:hypothetical protein